MFFGIVLRGCALFFAEEIEEWEMQLDAAGPMCKTELLVELYKTAPNGAPSLALLGGWLESNGVKLRGLR